MLWAMHFDRACDVEQNISAGSRNKGDFPQMTRACLALRMTACILVGFERYPQMTACILVEFERYPHSWRLVLVYNNEPYAAHSSSTRRLLLDYSDKWLVSIWEPTSLAVRTKALA